jgi:Breast carcinoma amplified sequence 3
MRLSSRASVPTFVITLFSCTVHVLSFFLIIFSCFKVIQDFCFSPYSQWVGIVSSKGTCHIFVISPFGGDASLQFDGHHTDGVSLALTVSKPWWSNFSFLKDQLFFPPPPPVTTSVVSRIKNSNSGWLNTVSNVAATATGKIAAPSGAMAAAFHNSISPVSASPKNKYSLEHLLVYSPSGHVIQHDLVPSSGPDLADNTSRVGPGSLLQDDELHVNTEPVQWWDVCRRTNWPERDENISRVIISCQKSFSGVDSSECEDNEISGLAHSVNGNIRRELMKGPERPNWYVSNAEVQINSGRIPIWQKSKVLGCYNLLSVFNCIELSY